MAYTRFEPKNPRIEPLELPLLLVISLRIN